MEGKLNLLLITEDPAEARRLADRLAEVRPPGFLTKQARQIDEGLRALREGRFDAVLLDISLAHGNAFAALEQLRTRAPQLPVLVLTSLDDEELAVSAVQAGAQDYLVKDEMSGRSLRRSLRHAVERQRVLAKLEELDRLKSEFVSAASHEMRTPLAIIREFVSLVRDEVTGPVNTEQKDCLESAVRNCDRLGELLGDLLELGKIESERMSLHRRSTDIDALLRSCRDEFLPRCRIKRQELHLDLPADLPAALCDEDKIRQVVVSLLANAHKFTPADGRLGIEARADGGSIEIRVVDDGPGIREDDQELVFDSFVQIGRSDGPGARGTGLGLPIAKGIVQMHGGSMSLSSQAGRGSRFSFTLPLHSERGELRAAVADHLAASLPAATAGCLMLIRCPRPGSEALPTTIDSVRDTAAAVLRPRDRILALPSERLLAVLLEADRHGSGGALSRLVQALRADGADLASLEVSITDLETGHHAERILAAAESSLAPLEIRDTAPDAKKILVIDDEEMMVEYVVRALASSGLTLETGTASSGYEGCIRFGELSPDLVILDINMDGLDGAEVLRLIRTAKRKSDTKVLVATGATTRIGEMVALGCDDYICKPFRISELLDKVTTLLGIDDDSEPLCRAC